jgi:hypothetical protein
MHGVRLLRLYRQEVAVMLFSTDSVRKREVLWRSPPWTEESAPWQAIDQSLPPGHLARRICAFVQGLDLNDLRRSYLGVGKPPFPPDLILMVVLYEMQSGQHHPCHWAEDCKFLDPVKWLARGLQPSAAYFYTFRQRLAPYVEAWNQELVRRAVAEQATQADEAAVDGTFLSALGSRHRLLQAKTLEQRRQALRQVLAEDARATRAEASTAAGSKRPVASGSLTEAAPPGPSAAIPADPAAVADGGVPSRRLPYWMAKTPRGRGRQLYRYRQAQERLDELLAYHKQRENRKAKRKRRSVEQVRICAREPEAALGRDKLKTFRPLYNVQLVRDLTTPLILGYGVYASNTDAGLLIPTLEKVQQTLSTMPKKVLADGIYATAANLGYCAEHGVTLYAPAADRAAAKNKKGAPHERVGQAAAPAKAKQLGKEQFRWEVAEETYYCPEGHRLIQIGCQMEKREQDQEVRVYQYRCPPQHCQACSRAAECTPAPHKGRTLKRSEHEDKVEALRQRMQTPEGQALYKKRSQTVEPNYGDLKTHRGMRGFTAIGRVLATVQVGLWVLVHNGLKLLKDWRVRASSPAPASGPAESCPSHSDTVPADHKPEAPRSQACFPQAPT